jgi:hypothetical protein
MRSVQHVSLATAMVALAIALSCGGTPEHGAEPESPTPTAVQPRAQRDRPVRVIDIDLDSCQRAAGPDERFRVIAHEKNAGQYTPSIEQAMTKAIDRSGSAYDWAAAEPVCVHVFSSDNAFLQGLQELGGFPPAESFNYRSFLGTTGFDEFTGRDAIFMNTVAATQPKSVAYLTTHEYFHIVQNHVANVGAPAWFLEGMAEWEALRLVGAPIPTWLVLLLTEERQGRSPPFSALQTSEQWLQIDRVASPYFKARAALLYLERMAGSDAPIRILKESADFEVTFREVSGLTIAEFEAGLPGFLEALVIEQASTPSAAP